MVHRAGPVADGLFLGDYGPEDANPDIGDSAITETAGIGGFAMAAAPAIVRFVGGTVPDALATTRRMYEITLAENPRWRSRSWSSAGTPTGIDVPRVGRTGILPQINTGMAGKVAGTGQVGAGLVTPPAESFPKALAALAARAAGGPAPRSERWVRLTFRRTTMWLAHRPPARRTHDAPRERCVSHLPSDSGMVAGTPPTGAPYTRRAPERCVKLTLPTYDDVAGTPSTGAPTLRRAPERCVMLTLPSDRNVAGTPPTTRG